MEQAGDVLPARLPLITPVPKKDADKKRLRIVRTLYFVNRWDSELIVEFLKKNNFPEATELQVKRDIEKLKNTAREFGKHAAEYYKDIESFVFELHDNYTERIKSLWSEHSRSKDSVKNRITILHEIREQEKQYLEFLQSFNLLPTLTKNQVTDKEIHYKSHLQDKDNSLVGVPAPVVELKVAQEKP